MLKPATYKTLCALSVSHAPHCTVNNVKAKSGDTSCQHTKIKILFTSERKAHFPRCVHTGRNVSSKSEKHPEINSTRVQEVKKHLTPFPSTANIISDSLIYSQHSRNTDVCFTSQTSISVS